ncbi:hypothetical protein BLAHAN_06577 [Blautia hansenii DSM 20583]|uniref:Uncharacterized protein n=1 Tax=Blautia hansenii DSM 20583 TaxID=537007 RepID=C9LAX3_BLAHA|nr:hypothetical protein BLAHAN_06577 [Blautia hansenii DSM 20583]
MAEASPFLGGNFYENRKKRSQEPTFSKRKIASTLTFLGGCFAATDI